jgi:hypothetical protein
MAQFKCPVCFNSYEENEMVDSMYSGMLLCQECADEERNHWEIIAEDEARQADDEE